MIAGCHAATLAHLGKEMLLGKTGKDVLAAELFPPS
jgi:hypothetical protein